MRDVQRYFQIQPQPLLLKALSQRLSSDSLTELVKNFERVSKFAKLDLVNISRKIFLSKSLDSLPDDLHFLMASIHEAVEREKWETASSYFSLLGELDLVSRKSQKGPQVQTFGSSTADKLLLESWLSSKPREYGEAQVDIPGPANEEQLNDSRKTILEVQEKTQEVLFGYFNELQTYVSTIKIFGSGAIRGVSDPRAFGAIYLRYPLKNKELFFIEHLIHETSHLHLFALLNLDPIILNDTKNLYASPLRLDKRPMFSVIHQGFVLWRLKDVFEKLSESKFDFPGIEQKINENKVLFERCTREIETHAIMTPMGKILLSSMGINTKSIDYEKTAV